MGFGNWLARRGNVGGTARAVAKGWKHIESQNPGMTDQRIAETYLEVRYGFRNEVELADSALALLGEYEPTPLNLTWVILLNENPNERDVILQKQHDGWDRIVREEIEKLGLAPE